MSRRGRAAAGPVVPAPGLSTLGLPPLGLGAVVLGVGLAGCVLAGPGRTAIAVAAVRARVPVEPDRDTARALAAEELSKREYQAARPSLLARALGWLLDQVQNLPSFSGTGPRLGLLLVVLVAVGAVVFAVQRSGGLRRQARVRAEAVFSDPTRSATDHRSAAEAAERAEDWRTAVLERFRAVTRELEERAVLVPQPGRTADEVAADAGAWLPDLAERLRAGAELFDDVRYGDRPASAAAATTLRELDAAVRRARPAAEAAPTSPRLVVPS